MGKKLIIIIAVLGGLIWIGSYSKESSSRPWPTLTMEPSGKITVVETGNDAGVSMVDGIMSVRRTPFVSVLLAGDEVLHILRSYKKSAENSVTPKRIKITYSSELFDRYKNNLGIKPVLTVDFDAKEAMKYNLDRANWGDMLNTAKIEYQHPAISDKVAEFCSENVKYRFAVCR